MITGHGLPWCSSSSSPTGSGCAIRLDPSRWIIRAAITSSLSDRNRVSVRPENPRVVGQGQEQVPGLRPLDEPVWNRNPRPLGAKPHEECVPPAGDKAIDVLADSNSQDIERGQGNEVRRNGLYPTPGCGGPEARCADRSTDEDEARAHGRERSRQDLFAPAVRPERIRGHVHAHGSGPW